MAYTTIDDGSAYHQTAIYSGTGSSLSVVNDGNSDLQPDWVWFKCRTRDENHSIHDSTRGVDNFLASNQTNAEATETDRLESFNADGFTVNGGDDRVNISGQTYVAWQWKANGGTTSSNTNGSITTTVQANTTAGFSIVTYTSAAGGQTIGHGLGVKPDMYIIKERTTSGDDWFVYHSALGEGKKLRLSGTSAAESDTNIWQNTAPTTTVAYLQNDGGGVNQNTGGNQNYVGYFFNNIQGYSKFGSYTGNGSTDGTFVYTGFRPAWLMIHRTDSAGENWQMFDNKRDGFNNGSSSNKMLKANVSETEDTNSTGFLDLVSNGFKIRESAARHNASGGTYIYMAFAEHPFVSSKGVPVTAR